MCFLQLLLGLQIMRKELLLLFFYRLNGSLPQTLLSGNIDNNFLWKRNKLTAFLFVLKLKLEEDGGTKLHLYKLLSDYQLQTRAEHLIKILSKLQGAGIFFFKKGQMSSNVPLLIWLFWCCRDALHPNLVLQTSGNMFVGDKLQQMLHHIFFFQ